MVFPNYRLLIISDAVNSNRTYQDYFQSANSFYDLSIVTSIAEGLDLCCTNTIDAVLLGGDLSDIDGLTFLESLAAKSRIYRPAVVMVSIEGDTKVAVRAMKLGAQDYLLERDLTPELLQSTIGSGIEKARLQLSSQEDNDRFRVALDNVLDSIGIFSAIRDEAGQITDFSFDYLNPSVLASRRITTAEMHLGFCEKFPAVRETGLFAQYCRVVETGEPLLQDSLSYPDPEIQSLTKFYDLRVVKLGDGVIATWRDITDRKQIELALQESEERLRLTIEAAELGTIDFNLLTGEIVWNATAEVFMGYEPGAAETYTYADFEARIHPDDRARVNADLVWVTVDRSDSNSEYRVILPDGRVRWMRGFGRFYDDAEGRAVRMLGTIEDITAAKCSEIQRQRAEESLQKLSYELEQQLQRFDSVASSVPDLISTFDLSGRLTYANQALLDLLQQSLGQTVGKNFYDLVNYPTELAERLQAQIQQVIATQQPIKDEIPYTSFQGTKDYEYIFSPLFSKDGVLEGVAGITRDINERKQAELALQASEQRYKALIDITTQIVWNTDAHGKMIYANAGSFTGQTFEESESGRWMEAVHPDDHQQTIELWLEAVANLTPYEVEHRVRRWDGEYRLMSGRAIPLFDDDGRLCEWVGLHTDVTDIRRDEQNLRRSEEFNRRILENNQDCIKVIDLEGRLLYMNDSGKKLLGIADFTQYDRSLWTNFWGGSDQNLAQSSFDSAKAGTISSFEGQCPTVTGIPKWWEVTVIPLHDEEGNVDQILLISHDLTERRQVEDELRLSQLLAQSQLREIEAIYQTAPIGLAIIDINLRFQRVNEKLAEMNGVPIADHIGRTVREVVPDLADDAEPLLRQVLETGEPLLNLEICGETSAQPGIYRTWNENFYPLKDILGQSTSLSLVVEEITERKISEAVLKESEERFRNTFEQAAVGIAHVALDGRWLLVNPKLCEIFGYTKAELLYGYFQDITHPDDVAQDQESIRRILADEIQLIELDKRYIHKLGHIVWVNIKGMLRRDDSGAPLYFIASIEDITYRKHAEISLQSQAEQLIETSAMVELRNQELNRFSYIVSHDLKAPLRGISNLATWISDDLPSTVDPEILANLELMRSRVARMGDLVDDLLEYARVGSTAANLETFSVEQLLADIVDLLSIPDSFTVNLPADLPPIRTNRVLLSQVLTNLIGNAYKHHDRSDGKIQVLVQPNTEMWEFSVIDDGRGIAPEHQVKVFEIFKTVAGTNKNNSGIGLSIVKKIVETQGGQIKLESQLGMGTTFYFTWMADVLFL